MLTPNAVKRERQEIESKIEARLHRIVPPLATRETLTTELYEKVLLEIAHGGVDPRNLALAALGKELR